MSERSAFQPAPTKAVIAFAEGVSRKDVIELAKGLASKMFVSTELARYCLVQFNNGWLYEIHEAHASGKKGKGHLTSIVTALDAGKEAAWFRVDGRVLSVTMKDGRPYGVILPEQQSATMVKAHPELEVRPTDTMTDVVAKGEKFMAVGMTVFFIGIFTLAGTLTYDIATKVSITPSTPFVLADAPHRQWDLVARTPRGLYVPALRYDSTQPIGTQWTVTRQPVARDEERSEAQPVAAGTGTSDVIPPPVATPAVDTPPASVMPASPVGQVPVVPVTTGEIVPEAAP